MALRRNSINVLNCARASLSGWRVSQQLLVLQQGAHEAPCMTYYDAYWREIEARQ